MCLYVEIMEKISLYFRKKAIEWLRQESERSGVPFSEMIRRAVEDKYPEIQEEQEKNVQHSDLQ